MIGGFQEPTAGAILIDGADVTRRPPFKRNVNTVFQNYALFPHMTVFENVAFGLRRRGVRGQNLNSRVRDALELVALHGFDRRKPPQLSGGQRQRVALARALVNHPSVLLLDEPLGALDMKLRRQMQLELKRIQSEVGITFIHVTHDQEEAMTMADTIAVMNEGHVEQIGHPVELYETPRTAFVAGFLGVSNLIEGSALAGDRVTLGSDIVVHVPEQSSLEPGTRVAVGVRPEKLALLATPDPCHTPNVLPGFILEIAYVGVATQYVVSTAVGNIAVYRQNTLPPPPPVQVGDSIVVSWPVEATFVVASGSPAIRRPEVGVAD
jgi:spermidine/putrescine transport system ATP-binding protein